MGYRFYNLLSNDPTLNANWTLDPTSNDNPGSGNNAANIAWIQSLRGGTSPVTISQIGGCTSLNVNFQFNTVGDTFIINYGDGTMDTNATGFFSHTYIDTGMYVIQVSWQTSSGCTFSDTLSYYLQTLPPLNISSTSICAGQTATLTPSTGSGTYNFYDAATGGNLLFTGGSFSVSPTLTTTYYVSEVPTPLCPNPPRTAVTVNVLASPNSSFTVGSLALNPTVCAPFLGSLIPTNAGGLFTGTGVTGNSVSYSTPGTYTISYTINSTCTSSTSQTITVLQAPDASFQLDTLICLAPISLMPATGTYSGIGVTGYTFTPPGLGVFQITHILSNGACSDTVTQTTQVVSGLGNAAFTGLQPTYCQGDPPSFLLPNNGLYSGLGMQGNVFTPDFPGTYVIVHTVQQGGCSDTTLQFVTVYPKPIITHSIPNQICESELPYALTALPSGGVFSGNGVNANTINGSTGLYEIYYTYTDPVTQCVNSDTIELEIGPTLSAEFTVPVEVCRGQVFSIQRFNSGGIFSGIGIQSPGSVILDTIGPVELTYTIGTNRCADEVRKTVEVVECPAAILQIPNVFSPNSDGINDVWNISSTVIPTNYSVKVVNRWGQELFASNNWGIGWNPDNNVSTGAYYYIITAEFERSPTQMLRGVLQIVR
jgi:gliding motility-associated-like protein